MAIITAPYLLDAGQKADWGYFCLSCRYGNGVDMDEVEMDDEDMVEMGEHFRTKYTRENMQEVWTSGEDARDCWLHAHYPNLTGNPDSQMWDMVCNVNYSSKFNFRYYMM